MLWMTKQINWITLIAAAAAAAKLLQLCPTLCDPIDGSPPGSPVPGILQARTLEWVAISFSNAWKWKVKMKSLSRVRLLATPWTAAHQAPPSMGFSRQEYWSGVPSPSPTLIARGNELPWVATIHSTSFLMLLWPVWDVNRYQTPQYKLLLPQSRTWENEIFQHCFNQCNDWINLNLFVASFESETHFYI